MGVSCLFSQVISNIMRGNSVKDSLVWTSTFFFPLEGFSSMGTDCPQQWWRTPSLEGFERYVDMALTNMV